MNTNRKSKLRYEELLENDPTGKESDASGENKFHDTPSPSRTICFVWLDGRQQFFSYAYLITGELSVEEEINVISLRFTSDVVTLKGYSLIELFSKLIRQVPSQIIETDPRYASDDEAFSVTEIIVMPII